MKKFSTRVSGLFKKLNSIKRNVFLFSSFLILGTYSLAFADLPNVFFSDMTDGPISGWNGSATQGAAVSIWGANFGNFLQGTSTVTVCGVTLSKSSDFAEWGATTNPTTARGLQRITFFLNSSMPTGANTITVTTSAGKSNSVPFYCRNTGNIYFVSRTGSDSNNGLSTTTPWLTASKVKKALVAGDVAYFRAGIYNKNDAPYTGAYSSVLYFSDSGGTSLNHANGTANNSISISSYPGEMAQLGDSSISNVFEHYWADKLYYWTFSKFFLRTNSAINTWTQGTSAADDNLRFIGNDASTYYGGGTIFDFMGSNGGQTNLFFYGNYLHDAATNFRGQLPQSGFRAYGLYLGGNGIHNNVDIGWNEICYNMHGRGIQIYGHTTDDWIDNLYIHDNFIHHNSMTGSVLGGGDGGTGWNGTPAGTNYVFLRNVWYYNNILAYNGDNTPVEGAGSLYEAIFLGGFSYGGNGGNYYLFNNTFYHNVAGELTIYGFPVKVVLNNNIFDASTSFIYVSKNLPGYPGCTVCLGSGYNLYFGLNLPGPSWDTNRLDNFDPGFASQLPTAYQDFKIQNTGSRAIGAGIPFALSAADFFGLRRPTKNYTLGAIEFNSSTSVSPGSPALKSIKIIN